MFVFSSSSLFTVSSGHAFVHVQPNTASCDPIGVMLHKLVKPALSTQWGKRHDVYVQLLDKLVKLVNTYSLELYIAQLSHSKSPFLVSRKKITNLEFGNIFNVYFYYFC